MRNAEISGSGEKESMMNSNSQVNGWILGMRLRKAAAAIASIVAVVFVAVVMQPAQAQTYTVLYSFTGLEDGGEPYARRFFGLPGNSVWPTRHAAGFIIRETKGSLDSRSGWPQSLGRPRRQAC
jgi:hypothetical protein